MDATIDTKQRAIDELGAAADDLSARAKPLVLRSWLSSNPQVAEARDLVLDVLALAWRARENAAEHSVQQLEDVTRTVRKLSRQVAEALGVN